MCIGGAFKVGTTVIQVIVCYKQELIERRERVTPYTHNINGEILTWRPSIFSIYLKRTFRDVQLRIAAKTRIATMEKSQAAPSRRPCKRVLVENETHSTSSKRPRLKFHNLSAPCFVEDGGTGTIT